MIAADITTDGEPSGYQNIQYPIHAVGIRSMGLWLVDSCGLEELRVRAALGVCPRWLSGALQGTDRWSGQPTRTLLTRRRSSWGGRGNESDR
jgi:hypothetical protein